MSFPLHSWFCLLSCLVFGSFLFYDKYVHEDFQTGKAVRLFFLRGDPRLLVAFLLLLFLDIILAASGDLGRLYHHFVLELWGSGKKVGDKGGRGLH